MLTLILYSIVKEQIFYDSLYTIYYFYILEITGIEPVTWLRPLSQLFYQL